MNDENKLHSSKPELPIEIVLRTCDKENHVNIYSIKDIVIYAESLINEKKFEEFRQMLGLFCQNDDFYQLLKDDKFLIAFLKYQLHLQQFSEIIQTLQNIESTCNPEFLELWDEVHYQQYFSTHGRLTSVHKFRIRQRNPPPSGLCVGGVRPTKRLLETASAVFREWFTKHSTYPYPCKSAKRALAKQAGVPVDTVTSWFSNARRKQKIKLEKIGKLPCYGGDEELDEQKTEGITSIEPYTALDQNEMVEGEICESTELPSIQTIGSETPSVTDESVVPSWSYNLPTTVQTTYPLDYSTSSRISSKEQCNSHRVPFSTIQESNGRLKYWKIQSECQTEGFRKCLGQVNETNDKTEHKQNKHQIKPFTDIERGYVLCRNPCLKKENGHIVKEVPENVGYSLYNGNCMKSDEQDIINTRAKNETSNQVGWVPENFKQAIDEEKIHMKTPWKVNNLISQTCSVEVVNKVKKAAYKTSEVDIMEGYYIGADAKHTEECNKYGHQSAKDISNFTSNYRQILPKLTLEEIQSETKKGDHVRADAKHTELCNKYRYQSAKDNSNFASSYRQILPKLTLEEIHSETKVPNETLILKLRHKLKDHKMKRKCKDRNKNTNITADDCIKSLQKLCDHVEAGVMSPRDYACSVEFDSLTDEEKDDDMIGIGHFTLKGDHGQNKKEFENISEVRTDFETRNVCRLFNDVRGLGQEEKMLSIERSDIVNVNKKEQFAAMSDTDIPVCLVRQPEAGLSREWSQSDQRKSPQSDQLVPCSPELFYASGSPLSPSAFESPFSSAVLLVPSPLESPYQLASSPSELPCLPEAEMDCSSTDLPYQLGSYRSPLDPGLSEIYSHSHAGELDKQNFRLSYPDPLSAWIGTGWSPTEGPYTDVHHDISRYSGNYGTVVKEAIQGLLNLSSSQESAGSCVDSTFLL